MASLAPYDSSTFAPSRRWGLTSGALRKHGATYPLSTSHKRPSTSQCGLHPTLHPASSREADCKTETAEAPHVRTACSPPGTAALREQLKDVHFLKPDYADRTKVNIAGILRKWKRYCDSAELPGSWREVIEKADRAMAMDFLLHMCEAYKIGSWGTSWEYFRQYKQLYASATGRYMDRTDSREILKWHDAVLVPRFKLQAPNSGGKDVADAGELLALQTFNIGYDTGVFSAERHRI